MRSSILICATCLLVTGCSAQLRFPSLSSALSSLTGFGSGSQSSSSSSGSNGQSSSGGSSSPYSGLVRDYGRNLMMAMSSIYPSIFKPPQSQQAASQQQPQQAQSPFEQFAASQPLQSLFSAATGQQATQSGGQSSGPSFSFGGSTFSISPSLPFGSLTGASSGSGAPQAQAQQQGSPFSASFGSSINSPPSFGPLSSGPFFQPPQSMGPSFAPASSYNAAFEAANGASAFGGQSAPSFHSSQAQAPPSGSNPGSQFQFSAQPFETSAGSLLSPSVHQSGPSFGSSPFMSGLAVPPAPLSAQSGGPHSLGGPQQQQQQQQQAPQQVAASAPQPTQAAGPQQFGQHQQQQYRPDSMAFAASAPVPSSNSYSSYGSIPAGPSAQQAPASSSYQPSYR